uniref:Amino acid transporter transmembrane domain-containing protein n=1 Tax=Timema cristinae TaxID=61476 RepID=A0A7R9GS34_TIMCR|nr:unnamed protein product [Timema cristinae]
MMSGTLNTITYESTGSRDPIWTRVSGDPKQLNASNQQGNVKETVRLDNDGQIASSRKTKGLNVTSTAIFIAGEMAGSGVLALPRAIVDCGWIGLVLVVVFCINAGYGGTRLGACWAILEERYPEHRVPVRNPYATIAYKAYGKRARMLVSGCIQFTLFGAGTVYLLLASQILQELLEDLLPNIGFCIWFFVISVLLCFPMWFGSPKDFWAVGVGALLTIAFACVLMFTQIVMDGLNKETVVKHQTHGFSDFFLSFGTILFSFGGASTFPTIQNDMVEKNKFSYSVAIGFSVILALYLPVSAGGYFVYGEDVDPNIVLSLSRTTLVLLANMMMGIHLVLAFLIVINPVCQELEEIFQVPHYFHWKRCLVRTLMVCVMIFVGETIPKFGKILSLVGGSTVTLLTFVFPPLFYMRLCDQKNVEWMERVWDVVYFLVVVRLTSNVLLMEECRKEGLCLPQIDLPKISIDRIPSGWGKVRVIQPPHTKWLVLRTQFRLGLASRDTSIRSPLGNLGVSDLQWCVQSHMQGPTCPNKGQ